MSLSLHADRQLVRTHGGSVRYVVARCTAPSAGGAGESRRRAPANVAFIVDRSGSMAGAKIEQARRAVCEGVALLGERDAFSVVAYADAVDVVSPSGAATEANRARAVRRVRALGVGGSTALHDGWAEGARGIVATLEAEQVARCLLLTDGRANVGLVGTDALAKVAADLRSRGISTSTFGVGADFDEGLLGRIADAGGGTFRFVERSADIARCVRDELDEALDVVAREVHLHLDLPEGATCEPLGPWRPTHEGRATRLALPDLVSRQSIEILLAVRFAAGSRDAAPRLRASVSSRGDALGVGSTELSFRYAAGREVDAQPRDPDVARQVVSAITGAAREHAALLGRDDARAAVEALRVAIHRIERYAAGDRELAAATWVLRDDIGAMSGHLDPVALKRMHFEASRARRGKGDDGRSRRSE
jgi:Ca-activated chloride channel family protein